MLPSNTVVDAMNGTVKRPGAHPHPLTTPLLNQKTFRQILSASSEKPLKNLSKRETLSHRLLLPPPSPNISPKHRRKRRLGRSPEKIALPNFDANQKR